MKQYSSHSFDNNDPDDHTINVGGIAQLYIPSTLNIGLILWHTQLNVCAENVNSWIKSWVTHFTFQA